MFFYSNIVSIKEANKAKKKTILVYNNNKTYKMLFFLRQKGLIINFHKNSKFLKVYLNTCFENTLLEYIKFDSTPGRTKFYSFKELKKIAKKKLYIFSCDIGLYSSNEVSFLNRGGFIIFFYR